MTKSLHAMHDPESIDIFASAAVIPVQFYAGGRPETWERRLMLAVLEIALCECSGQFRCYTRPRKKQTVMQEAREWIESGEIDWPFAFESICERLEIDAGYIRRLVKAKCGHQIEVEEITL